MKDRLLPPLERLKFFRKEDAQLICISNARHLWFHEIPTGQVWLCLKDGLLIPDPLPDPIDEMDIVDGLRAQLRRAICELEFERLVKR